MDVVLAHLDAVNAVQVKFVLNVSINSSWYQIIAFSVQLIVKNVNQAYVKVALMVIILIFNKNAKSVL